MKETDAACDAAAAAAAVGNNDEAEAVAGTSVNNGSTAEDLCPPRDRAVT